MTTENRWATPTILEVQWPLDALPNYIDEDAIAATLAMPATNKDGVASHRGHWVRSAGQRH